MFYPSFFQVTFLFPKWRSLSLWKGHWKHPKRSQPQEPGLLKSLDSSQLLFSNIFGMNPLDISINSTNQLPLLPSLLWKSNKHTVAMGTHLLHMRLPNLQNLCFLFRQQKTQQLGVWKKIWINACTISEQNTHLKWLVWFFQIPCWSYENDPNTQLIHPNFHFLTGFDHVFCWFRMTWRSKMMGFHFQVVDLTAEKWGSTH